MFWLGLIAGIVLTGILVVRYGINIKKRIRQMTNEEAINHLIQETKLDTNLISDGYHTFNELYEFRKAFNAALFNSWSGHGIGRVHKSKKHHDGYPCFGGKWFIVVAYTEAGQISNHYKLEDWSLFQVEEKELADEWDGHTALDVLDRLKYSPVC